MKILRKQLLFVAVFFTVTITQAQNIGVALRGISGTPPQLIGSPAQTSIWEAGDPEAYFVLRVCNTDFFTDLANYRIMPLVSAPGGGQVEISSNPSDHKFFDVDSGVEVPCTVLVANASTFRFSNATYGIPALSCIDVYIKFNPILPNPSPANYLTNVNLQFAAGFAPGSFPGSQTIGNDLGDDTGVLAFRIEADVIAVDDVEMTSPITTLNGNLLTNDTHAFTVASASQGMTSIPIGVPTSIVGGEITINSDGSYTFVPNNTLGSVPAINYVADNINSSSSDDADLLIEVATGLPVEFKGMQVTCLNGGRNAEITWQTGSELNAQKFIIERSFNGAFWNSIGEVAAVGTTNQQSNYSYVDVQNRTSRTAYYRLSQVDIDGTTKVYPVVVSDCEMESEAKLYPNPATDITYVEIIHPKNENVVLEVRNTLGSLISSSNHALIDGLNLISLEVEGLEPGNYFVVITDENKERKTLKFVKQ